MICCSSSCQADKDIHHLSCWDVGAARGDFPRSIQLKEANAVHDQLQQVHPQDHSVQLERLCTVVRSPHVWRDRKGLVVVTPQGLYNLPDLQLKIFRIEPSNAASEST